MPVIAIIGYRIFEDGVVHIIEKDPELNQIIHFEKEDSTELLWN